MKKVLILLLPFLPLTLFSQQLECCKSVQEVSVSINGYWKMKNSDLNEQWRFEFSDGIGMFWKYQFNENIEVIEIKEFDQTLEIFETQSGFELDWSDGNRIVTARIKILNATSLVFVRRDGKEAEYYKINK